MSVWFRWTIKLLTCNVDVSADVLTEYSCGGSDVVISSVLANAKVVSTFVEYHLWFRMHVGSRESYVVLKGLKTVKARLSFHLCWRC
ncbi:MAG: hypothetical protein ACKESB_00480 [Candidatus Hodgkinia cicadicola]